MVFEDTISADVINTTALDLSLFASHPKFFKELAQRSKVAVVSHIVV